MFTLKIETSNAAFSGEAGAYECARILRALAAQITDSTDGSGRIRDINGNVCGSWSLALDGGDDE